MPLLLGAPLLIIVAGLVAYGLAYQSRQLGSGWIGWLAQQAADTAGVFGLGAEAALNLARWLSHELGSAFKPVESVLARWLSGLARYVREVGEATLLWPVELFATVQWLSWHLIPRKIAAALKVVYAELARVAGRVHVPARVVIRMPKLTRAQVKAALAALLPATLLRDIPLLEWLRRHRHALAHAIARTAGRAAAVPAAIAHDLPVPWGRTIRGVRARLRRLEKLAAGGLAVAAVVAALGKLRLGWLRCRNWRRAGRAVCGLDVDLLEALIAGSVVIAGSVSIKEVTRDLQAVMGELTPLVGRFVTEVRADAAADKVKL